jgi:imidazolonepropionase-like amidohydrolase
VESHAHPSFANTSTLEALGEIPPEEHTLLTMRHVKLLLDQGFTSINSAAAAKPRLDVVIRNAINGGEIPGPRMLAASPELTVTGGLGDVRLGHLDRDTFAIVCDGPEEFRRVSREMCREGVDTLKINPSGDEFVPFARAHQTVMNEAEVEAVAEVARSRDKRLAAHARSAESVKMSLRHGCEIVYHATLADEEAKDMLEAVKDKVFVSPTLGVTITTLFEASDWGITEEVATSLGLRRELEIAVENMKDLKKRGVRVLPGGDYGFAWNPVGANARDLEHFVNYLDFTPMEAIEAATRLGGQIMMMGDELGEIKEGYLADLLLVDGDPLADVSILQDQSRLLGIMKDGSFHKRPAADLAAQRQAA